MRAECEAEHSKAWSLLLKSAKTFSEGFKSGLAMGVLERQLVNNATVYIVKLRAGMNSAIRVPDGTAARFSREAACQPVRRK